MTFILGLENLENVLKLPKGVVVILKFFIFRRNFEILLKEFLRCDKDLYFMS